MQGIKGRVSYWLNDEAKEVGVKDKSQLSSFSDQDQVLECRENTALPSLLFFRSD